LQRLQFERGFFGGGFFLGLKVAPNTNAVEAALNAEGINSVTVFEPADSKQWVGHA
jgi:hypothetical protein